jgi:hypothetical protein
MQEVRVAMVEGFNQVTMSIDGLTNFMKNARDEDERKYELSKYAFAEAAKLGIDVKKFLDDGNKQE